MYSVTIRHFPVRLSDLPSVPSQFSIVCTEADNCLWLKRFLAHLRNFHISTVQEIVSDVLLLHESTVHNETLHSKWHSAVVSNYCRIAALKPDQANTFTRSVLVALSQNMIDRRAERDALPRGPAVINYNSNFIQSEQRTNYDTNQ